MTDETLEKDVHDLRIKGIHAKTDHDDFVIRFEAAASIFSEFSEKLDEFESRIINIEVKQGIK